jgi:hypothetical protein
MSDYAELEGGSCYNPALSQAFCVGEDTDLIAWMMIDETGKIEVWLGSKYHDRGI